MERAFQILELDILRLLQQFLIQAKPDKQFQGQIWVVRGAITVRTLHFVVEQKVERAFQVLENYVLHPIQLCLSQMNVNRHFRGKFG